MRTFGSAIRSEVGATAVEYGLIIGAVAIAIVAAVGMLGTRMTQGMGSAQAALAASEQDRDAAALSEFGPPPEPDSVGAGSPTEGTTAGTSAGTSGASADGSSSGSASSPATDPAMQAEQVGTSGVSGATTSESGSPSEAAGGAVEAAGTQGLRTMNAADWAVLGGSADISGTTITTTPNKYSAYQNTNVLNSAPWANPDITLASTMRLLLPEGVTGYGYGVWLRATPDSGGTKVDSALSFQVDPGAGNAFVLKVWSGGRELTLARTLFPAGFDPAQANQVKVELKGDTFVAQVAGNEVLRVNSLSTLDQAKDPSGQFPLPTGTSFGLRVWQKANAEMTDTAVG